MRNRAVKSHVHSAVKIAQEAIGGSDAEQAASALREAIKLLGKAASKGVIHRNTVSRKISRLARSLNRTKAQAAG
jgi:small subunit ribosomal protein S20